MTLKDIWHGQASDNNKRRSNNLSGFDRNMFTMDRDNKISNVVMAVGAVLCGTVLSSTAYDPALTTRHIIWCFVTIVLLCLIRKPVINKTMAILSVGFLLACATSGMFAVNTSEWLYSFLRSILMVSYLLMASSVLNAKFFSKTMVCLGVFYVLYAWCEFSCKPVLDCIGVMCNRNPWSMAHFLILPFCYYLVNINVWKWFSLSVGICLLVNIALLSTRSVMLGVLVSAIVMFIVNRKTRIWLIPLFILIFIGIFVKWDALINTDSMSDRFPAWLATVDMIKDNPLGVGCGNWKLVLFKYGNELPRRFFINSVFRHPHNDHLWILAETGIVGLSCYAGLYLCASYNAIKNKRYHVLIALSGYAVIAFFSFPWERAFSSMILVIFMVMAFRKKNLCVNRAIIAPLVMVLLSFIAVLGFRHRSLCYNKQLRATRSWVDAKEYCKGYSRFSTLTYVGLPWQWWAGLANVNSGDIALAKKQLDMAHEDSPYNVHVIKAKNDVRNLK